MMPRVMSVRKAAESSESAKVNEVVSDLGLQAEVIPVFDVVQVIKRGVISSTPAVMVEWYPRVKYLRLQKSSNGSLKVDGSVKGSLRIVSSGMSSPGYS